MILSEQQLAKIEETIQEFAKKYHINVEEGFDPLDEQVSLDDRALIGFYILHMQIHQGGVIQAMHNGFAPWLYVLLQALAVKGRPDIIELLDPILLFYATHHEQIDAPEDAASFAKLYGHFPQAEILDENWLSMESQVLELFITLD